MDYGQRFGVIVVGGGHAGTEAALAAARLGVETLLLTHNLETLGQMSCNPAIGGIGKGHLVKEIDALGGLMAQAADQAGIQFRILNASKGPAVRATRAQADRQLYRQTVRAALDAQPSLQLFQQAVSDLIVQGDRVMGVVTQMGLRFYADAVVLTAGTFLAGKIHVGLSQYAGGRAGDPPADHLAARLRELPLRVGRLKTGTPPRLDGNTIAWNALALQPGDTPVPVFSFLGQASQHPAQLPCYITHTNARTHAIIQAGLDRSPLYTGVIEGTGPRYCPSIEDKVMRFAQREAHQIFLEPEGLHTREIYPNGISTSLPFDVQLALVQSIAGLEQARIIRPGYAIEYDFFDPRDLQPTLETKALQNLFFAGQINGTTGYEEAAAQGLIAGLNAARRAQGQAGWYPRRDQAYLGVLIDDLITQGAPEPYRMFTSRAEYRLRLREDNADLRLTPVGRELGLVDDQRWQAFTRKQEALATETVRCQQARLRPGTPAAARYAAQFQTPLSHEATVAELLRRPEVSYAGLAAVLDWPDPAVPEVAEQLEIQARYAGYIERQDDEIARTQRYEQLGLPLDLAYQDISGLSNEVREKLAQIRPPTLGAAGRIPGVTPAAISLLLVHLKKLRKADIMPRTDAA